MLRNKEIAPGFTLPYEEGQETSLTELRAGKILLLVFLRFAGCPTTQRDLLAYADVYGRLQSLDAELVVVTVDTIEQHRSLKERLDLPFHLLSDPDFAVSQTYGVYRSDETDHGPQPHGEPAVFIIDREGEIAYSQICTGPKGIASPSELALVILYMKGNNGKYW